MYKIVSAMSSTLMERGVRNESQYLFYQLSCTVEIARALYGRAVLVSDRRDSDGVSASLEKPDKPTEGNPT